MKEPWFWRDKSIAARAAAAAMTPAALLYDGAQRLRAVVSRPAKISAPVICIGNATLGGTGKTPFALMLQRLLAARGVKAHFLSRGYGGALKGPLRVLPQHTAQDVGDEPVLLAAAAPTWIARNRAAGTAAAAHCAGVVIMDDGFQNPTVAKAFSVLLVNADDPGDGRVFPAGPMREPLARAVARADAVVLIGKGSPKPGTGDVPIFRATTAIDPGIAPQRCVAFCGIANPERFFKDLEARGFTLTAKAAFADHHPFTDAELAALRKEARRDGAALITTEKDFMRLAPEARDGVAVARLTMSVDDPERLTALALSKIGRAP